MAAVVRDRPLPDRKERVLSGVRPITDPGIRPDWNYHALSGGSVTLCTIAGVGLAYDRILCPMIEEYARHNGNADLLRESVDGLTGE